MKKNITKIAIALSTLGFISSSYAMNAFNNGLNGFNFKLGGTYLQFSNNGTNLTTVAVPQGTRIYNMTTDYHPGVDAGIGYHLAATDTDFNLDYTHLHTFDARNLSGSRFTVGAVLGDIVSTVRGTDTFNYDSVDLTAGHWISVNPTAGFNYYGGVNYSNLTKDFRISGTGFGTDYALRAGSTFKGWGPTIGFNGECRPSSMVPNFNVFGGMKTNVLFGTMTGYLQVTNNRIVDKDYIPKEQVVIPSLGGKLGVGYDLPMSDVLFKTQLGYQAVNYFNVTRDSTYTGNTISASFQGMFLDVTAQIK